MTFEPQDSLVFLSVEVHVGLEDVEVEKREKLVFQVASDYLYVVSGPLWGDGGGGGRGKNRERKSENGGREKGEGKSERVERRHLARYHLSAVNIQGD